MARPDARQTRATVAKWAVLTVASAAALYGAVLVYATGHAVVGSMWLGLYALGAYVYGSQRAQTYRYLFPGLAGMAVFVVFPLLFTVWLGFTEYSSSNILTFERARSVLLSKTFELPGRRYDATLHADGDRFRVVLSPEGAAPPGGDGIFGSDRGSKSIFDDDRPAPGGGAGPGASGAEDGAQGAKPEAADGAQGAPPEAAAGAQDGAKAAAAREPVVYVTPPLDLAAAEPVEVQAIPLAGSGFTPGAPLEIRDILAREAALDALTVRMPDSTALVKSTLRQFAAEQPRYVEGSGGALADQETGQVLAPNFDTGFFEAADGQRVTPGFRVFVGLDHYRRLLGDRRVLQPFFRIFLWTVAFAGLTVLLTLIVGVLLAELLDWEGLRFRAAYRVLLFLPYAVPGFISILVFKGLFNENFGEINRLLEMVLGIKPYWFSSPTLAKVMILIVNTWLGYPYIMLLWMGLRQSVPRDLYEASALAGAGPFTNFFKITWPLVRKPLTPLLVSSFAFNFNNFVLIALLTDGRPDFLDTNVPAGTTDILVSYTYRIAFQDTGKNFGLAAAISTVIFLMVSILSIINLRLTKANASGAR